LSKTSFVLERMKLTRGRNSRSRGRSRSGPNRLPRWRELLLSSLSEPRSDASTLAVIQRVRDALPRIKAAAPDDVDIRLEFDQSRFVVNAITGLTTEAGLGALLTGILVLVFLRDWRSSLIVVLTIPFALLSAVVWLWMAGQTINIMTLGGLALACRSAGGRGGG
jgi:Cu/Ag efflux pump CusA